MLIVVIRALVIFVLLNILLRIMGKRQIGQLQPIELVITILISEIAAQPLTEYEANFVTPVITLVILVSLEIVASTIGMKSVKFRNMVQGNSLIIIRNGVLDQAQIKRLRFTLDDILEALRKKDVFRIEDVQYAIAETDGSLSVMLKPEKRNYTKEDGKINASDNGIPSVVVSDGKIIQSDFKECGMNYEKLMKIISSLGKKPEDIMLMTIDKAGNTYVIDKEKNI